MKMKRALSIHYDP